MSDAQSRMKFFDSFDANGDGMLSRTELRKVKLDGTLTLLTYVCYVLPLPD